VPISRRVEGASAQPGAAARAGARAGVPMASASAPFAGNALRQPRFPALAAAITGSHHSCTLCSQRFLRAPLLRGLTTSLSRRAELPRLLRSSLILSALRSEGKTARPGSRRRQQGRPPLHIRTLRSVDHLVPWDSIEQPEERPEASGARRRALQLVHAPPTGPVDADGEACTPGTISSAPPGCLRVAFAAS